MAPIICFFALVFLFFVVHLYLGYLLYQYETNETTKKELECSLENVEFCTVDEIINSPYSQNNKSILQKMNAKFKNTIHYIHDEEIKENLCYSDYGDYSCLFVEPKLGEITSFVFPKNLKLEQIKKFLMKQKLFVLKNGELATLDQDTNLTLNAISPQDAIKRVNWTKIYKKEQLFQVEKYPELSKAVPEDILLMENNNVVSDFKINVKLYNLFQNKVPKELIHNVQVQKKLWKKSVRNNQVFLVWKLIQNEPKLQSVVVDEKNKLSDNLRNLWGPKIGLSRILKMLPSKYKYIGKDGNNRNLWHFVDTMIIELKLKMAKDVDYLDLIYTELELEKTELSVKCLHVFDKKCKIKCIGKSTQPKNTCDAK